ncbi:MAG: TIGR04141 family sporadically distributed protein [Erysipelotrichales bacterium]|nr:TIGR04141 family sporadically distributed protein [Erysipelotrichales bacterium]
MQYNIFKIKDKRNLLESMEEKDYKRCGNEITSGDYKLNLYCKYEENQKISWKSVFDAFGESNIPNKSGVSSIVLCSKNDDDTFVITYGPSSFLAQKYCDREFGFDFAKRIELDEIKRKSSITASSNKNSSITSYKNTKTILYDTGENITSLSFTPLNEFYGKRIDIGKSIKFNIDIPFDRIHELLDVIKNDLQTEPINKIPLLVEVKNEEEIAEYYEIMYQEFRKELEKFKSGNLQNYNSVDLNEFTIVGCNFYFENEESRLLKIGRTEYLLETLTMEDLFKFSIEKNLDIQQLVESAKIVYKDESNATIYSEYFKNHINYELPDKNICFYDGRWYEYNNDYIKLIQDEVKTIKVIYEEKDNINKSDLDGKEGLYREAKVNKILSDKYSGILLDRDCLLLKYDNEFNHNDYKVEIADFVADNTYFSLKIGDAQSLSYCVDQSLLSANLINAKIVNLPQIDNDNISKFGLWFYLEKKMIFNNLPIDLLKLNSIMLISKLSIWSKQIKSMGKEPIIHINKYESK